MLTPEFPATVGIMPHVLAQVRDMLVQIDALLQDDLTPSTQATASHLLDQVRDLLPDVEQ